MQGAQLVLWRYRQNVWGLRVGFAEFYQLFGGLGMFIFGMLNLSESLQAISGGLIRKVINALTSNILVAVGVGALATTLVQSSSVTTVMVVGLVNASLMELSQAIGVIMGANIGTTITGWIIAIKVGKYGLLFIALGIVPLMMARNAEVKSVGRLLLAIGLIFMGLEFMSGALKPLSRSETFQHLLIYFTASNYVSLWACILVGTILTVIVQSSSAMLGVTIALASTGAITFQTAAALVLGENIGTTITAILASIGANSNAKRAARAHALFNIGGVLWLSPFFWYYTELVDWIVAGIPDFINASGDKPYVAAHIAAGHSLFNVVNTIVFLPFAGYLAKVVTWMTPAPDAKEIPRLRYLAFGAGKAPDIAIAAAEKELNNLFEIAKKLLEMTESYVFASKADPKLQSKINRYEDITDSIQGEITFFLCKVQEGTLSSEQSSLVYGIIRAADELESIGDYCAAMARYVDRLHKSKEDFTPDAVLELKGYFASVKQFFVYVQAKLTDENVTDTLKAIKSRGKELSETGNDLWQKHLARLEAGSCSPVAGMLYSDLMVSMRKIKSHLVNIYEALKGMPTSD